jgi:TonB-dependent receptor
MKSSSRAQLRHTFTVGICAAALATAFAAPGVAAAQDDATVSDVVVTGFRGSLARALSVKREESVAVDTILAEDIGKFPDLNLSESLQRIPGVSITREGGEGRQISVRGLTAQFTRVRINGLEALATTGGTDPTGGVNRGRSFDFNVFASDLFNSLSVRKTQDAQTDEGSLGSTVDLRTARPFDYKGFTLVGSAQVGYNDLSETTSPRGSFLVSNTWADGTFGALLSVAYSERSLFDDGSSTVRWASGSVFAPGFDGCNAGLVLCGPAATNPTAVNPDPTAVANNAALHARFPRYDHLVTNTQRLGVTSSFQWEPTDQFSLNLDLLYANFSGDREEQYLEARSFNTAGATGIGDMNVVGTPTILPAVDGSRTVLIKGTFDDVDLRAENRYDELETKFTQATLTGTYALSDRTTVDFLAGASKSDFDNSIQTTIIFDQNNVDGYSYDYTDSRNPVFNYGNAKLTDPTAWTLAEVRQRPQVSENTYSTFQTNAHFDLEQDATLHMGASWKDYGFSTVGLRRSNGTSANQETVIPAAIATAAANRAAYSKTVELGGATTVIPDYFAAVQALSLNDRTIFPLGPEPDLANTRSIDETDLGAYIQVDWRSTLFGMPFRGDAGLRYAHTKQVSDGYSIIAGAITPVNTVRDYEDLLPAANAVLEPTQNVLIRFGVAKVMSRPDLPFLAPGVTINVSGANRTVASQNPNLDPIRATTYDLAAEWYFAKNSLLSVALFRKDIDSIVQTLQTITPFNQNPFGLPDSVVIAACGTTTGCDPTTNFTFTTPVNAPGTKLQGVELNYQQALTFLPGFLADTGLLLNYTYVESEVNYLNSAGAVVAVDDITNLSRNAYNATVYYEKGPLSARISAAYRDRYLTRVPGQEQGINVDGTNETFNVDASVQYAINDHIRLSVEGVNLTDEHQDQFTDSRLNLPVVYHHTGREVLFGIRYTY